MITRSITEATTNVHATCKNTVPQALVELQSLTQWCCFKKELRNEGDEKPTKIPYHPSNYRASSKKSASWSTHEAVTHACKAVNNFSGIGFFFNGETYSGIDIDDCVENGIIAEWARNIIRLLDSYAELSTSGMGVHIIVRGLLPTKIFDSEGIEYIKGWKNNPAIDNVPKGKLEIYGDRRFFVTTGNHVPGTPTTINERQDELLSILNKFFVEPKEEKQREFYKRSPKLPDNYQPSEVPQDDNRLWQIIFREKGNGPRWERLYFGDTGDYMGDESAADFALASKLAFYTQHDGSRVEGMMWQTGLARDKWISHPTYMQMTIRNAMKTAISNYDPKYGKRKEEELDKFMDDLNTNQHSNGKRPYAIKAKPVPAKAVEQFMSEMQFGDGKLFQACFGEQAVYDHIEHEWYLWSGQHWKRDANGFVKVLVSGHLGEVYIKASGELNRERAEKKQALDNLSGTVNENGDIEISMEKKETEEEEALKNKIKRIDSLMKQFQARSKDLRKSGYKNAILDYAMTACSAPLNDDDTSVWDSKKALLGLKNGVLDLRTGAFRDGRPDDYIRTVCPTEWKGLEAECPLFEQFLQAIFKLREDKDEIIRFLQRLLGYALTGTCQEALFVILCGALGRNGKTTLFKILTAAIGKALVGDIQKELLLDSGKIAPANGAKPDVLALQGKRFAIAAETKKGDKLNISAIKNYTGGDELSGRPIHGKHFVRFEPTHTLFLHTNYKPHADADDAAFWARACLIDFEMRFVEEPDPSKPNESKYDPSLIDRIIENELSGVLAWVVRGALEYRKIGLKKPESVKLANENYRVEEDTLLTFIKECCIVGEGYRVGKAALYIAYKEWSAGTYQLNSKEFPKQMKAKFTPTHTKEGDFYLGIDLLGERPHDPGERSNGTGERSNGGLSPSQMPIVDDITSQASQFADIEPIIHSAEKSGERSEQTFTKVPSGNSKNFKAGDFTEKRLTSLTSVGNYDHEAASEANSSGSEGTQKDRSPEKRSLTNELPSEDYDLCGECLVNDDKETIARHNINGCMYCDAHCPTEEPSIPDDFNYEENPCTQCSCGITRQLGESPSCVRCYPPKGYHTYSHLVDMMYPRVQAPVFGKGV